LTLKFQDIIRKYVGKEWSPEQIQGRLKLNGHEMVCPATIYRFIKQDKAAGADLYKN
jgi:IS30 family transposase